LQLWALPYWHVAHHTSVVDYDVSGNHVTPETSVNNCQSTQYYTPEERRLKFVEFEEWRLKNSDDGSGILCRNVGKILPDHTASSSNDSSIHSHVHNKLKSHLFMMAPNQRHGELRYMDHKMWMASFG